MTRTGLLAGAPATIVVGELLLVVCSVCYLVWWTLTYRPLRPTGGGGPFLAGAVLAGLGGIVLLAVGTVALLSRASSSAVAAVVVGGVVLGAALLWLTSVVAHRPVTTELPLIVVWATAQAAAGVALATSGVISTPTAYAWFAATAVATLVGLACYLVFYRLDPTVAFRVGMVPLAVDGVVAAVLTAILVLSRLR